MVYTNIFTADCNKAEAHEYKDFCACNIDVDGLDLTIYANKGKSEDLQSLRLIIYALKDVERMLFASINEKKEDK